MNLEEMKKLKKERGYSNEQICEFTGVPIGTVRKIFSGETKHPRYETLKALEKLFAGPFAPEYPGPVYDFYPDRPPVLVKERDLTEAYSVFKGGTYTADDLDRLRGDKGFGELMDGVLINMASPPVSHQLIQGVLIQQLRNYVEKQGGKCITFGSPLDVHLEKNDRTVLQPDVTVICDRDLIQGEKIWGAPDFVIEILSKSTMEYDRYDKLKKYALFGVREFWIVDPFVEQVIVHDFEHNNMISLYTFHDQIPVSIWEGSCLIDFEAIWQELQWIK